MIQGPYIGDILRALLITDQWMQLIVVAECGELATQMVIVQSKYVES